MLGLWQERWEMQKANVDILCKEERWWPVGEQLKPGQFCCFIYHLPAGTDGFLFGVFLWEITLLFRLIVVNATWFQQQLLSSIIVDLLYL